MTNKSTTSGGARKNRKYHYPKTDLDGIRWHYGMLNVGEIVDMGARSPLQKLLDELKKDGYDVSGCVHELKSMRRCLSDLDEKTRHLLDAIFDLRNVGRRDE